MSEPPTIYHCVAALLREGDRMLLVEQQGPNDAEASWALPGGVAEPGELLTEALIREVREETGIEVLDTGRVICIAHTADREHPHLSLALTFEVARWQGELSSRDPDGLVLRAAFLPLAEAIEKLEALPIRGMREPIVAYLRGEVEVGEVWE